MSTDRNSVKTALAEVDFPISKENLVEYAENNGVDPATLGALRALPRADYDNISDVIGAVPLDKGTEEGQSDSDKAQQHRHNTKAGLSEQHTATPTNPIVEELGENRGS